VPIAELKAGDAGDGLAIMPTLIGSTMTASEFGTC